MRRLALILAASAVLLPAPALLVPLLARENPVNLSAEPERQRPELGLQSAAMPPLRLLEEARNPEPLNQVRIERRVIIRIAPSPPEVHQRLMAEPLRSSDRPTYREVPHEDCVSIDQIAGVTSTRDNRLLLFMRNRRVLAATLDRACSARGFYSGFYVERSKDGQLCASRDQLRSRAGQSCAIDGLSRLVQTGG